MINGFLDWISQLHCGLVQMEQGDYQIPKGILWRLQIIPGVKAIALN